MATENVNQWFGDPNRPCTDIAGMLIKLDQMRVIPVDMREAIHKHANNSLESMPLSIAGIASSLASAVSGDSGLANNEITNVAYGMAAMSEQLHAWRELADQFGPQNTHRAA